MTEAIRKGRLYDGSTFIADLTISSENIADVVAQKKTIKSKLGKPTDVYNTRKKLPIQLNSTKVLLLPKVCHKTMSCSGMFETNNRISRIYRDKILNKFYFAGVPDIGLSIFDKAQALIVNQFNIDQVVTDLDLSKYSLKRDYHLINTDGLPPSKMKEILDFLILNYSPVTLRSLPREVFEEISLKNTNINLSDFGKRSLFVTMSNSYYGGFVMRELRDKVDLIIPITMFTLRVNKEKVSE